MAASFQSMQRGGANNMLWTNESDAKAYFSQRDEAVRQYLSIASGPLHRLASEGRILPTSGSATNIDRAGTRVEFKFPDEFSLVSISDMNFGAESRHIVCIAPARAVAVCDAQQNEVNRKAIEYFNGQKQRSLNIKAHCDTYSQATTDMTYYQYLVDDFNANVVDPVNYYACEPTVSQLQVAYNDYWNALQSGYASAQNAFAIAYANANREVSLLQSSKNRVQSARQNFDQSAPGADLAVISQAHADFIKQRDVVAGFKLISEGQYDASKIFGELSRLVNEEAKYSAVTELDNLRQEYYAKGIPVPTPTEFTQSKSSAKFSFSQLKTSGYSWAILRDTLLNNLDAIASHMESKGYKVQLNSVYRNPMHPSSSGTSQHQYGTAVDIQVFDFDGSGGIRDEEDWNLLREITDKYGPVYTEPVLLSGVGHVHVDWRGMSIFLETRAIESEKSHC
jgi:hypothetical protein